LTDTEFFSATALPDMPHLIRPIASTDDAAVASVIRSVMTEMGASGPGFAIHDSEVDGMFQAYQSPRSAYRVVQAIEPTRAPSEGFKQHQLGHPLASDFVVGGGGIAPLAGGADDVCELKKMYFLPQARGLGLGRMLIEQLIDLARQFQFRLIYLETLTSMTAAQRLYIRQGFKPLDGPMGCTCHFGCDRWFIKSLE
jgi:putative acetyltransferase